MLTLPSAGRTARQLQLNASSVHSCVCHRSQIGDGFMHGAAYHGLDGNNVSKV